MPNIANQDFKIYGKLSETVGIPGIYCGELHAALAGIYSFEDYAHMADGFVFIESGDNIARQTGPGIYYDYEAGEFKQVFNTKSSPEYYRAIWAIQQAIFAADRSIAGEGIEFDISGLDGSFREIGESSLGFIDIKGFLIKGTSADGKLASLFLGERPENPENYAVVRLESLLPLVGELPLETTEIW